ncbi:SMI1/KNR4 family protein [Bhargavaea beijingensis]|uniref:SMI1/KNR4 family protein n=1 Tax=Bhargavaea beijingensis TaxID=426756 RepID=UPI0022259FF9|nr:SMI1/KNR4 family protein [Bhargavaea beijingensis]MCW1929660.1 SMI1/KNR4 family protein [Bhargavaea beijingensis]
MSSWKDKIATMCLVKQELMKRDKTQLWPHHLPEVGAEEDQLKEAETALGYSLDPLYRDFLLHVDGWKGFYQTVDLFGSEQLRGSDIMGYAVTLLNSIESEIINYSGFKKEQLLPIATSMADQDLFVITLPDSPSPGMVIWYAGEEIDRFENFEEYFLAMIDYNREEVFELDK